MRALLSTKCGGPETLELLDIPDPAPGPGELLIRVQSCGVNYPDLLIIEDRYQHRPQRPFAPGSEVAGIVEAVGPEVSGYQAGDRVVALTFHGGMVEKIAVPAAGVTRIADDIDGAKAAMLLTTYATSYHALVDRARMRPGETLLVLGAAGGVGLTAVELGKALGARVIAAVSSEEKAKAAGRAGADQCLIYTVDSDVKDGREALTAQLRAAVGSHGADVIYDPIGGAFTEAALRVIAWGGRHLVVGFVGGIPKLPLNLPLLKGCDVVGVLMGSSARRFPERQRRNVAALLDLYRAGTIDPLISAAYPLERAGEAMALLAERAVIGKVIVTMDRAA